MGRLKLHGLNRENPLVDQLKVLCTIDELLPKFERYWGQGEIYIYGSAARGDGLEDSDLDILVIGRERSVVGKLKLVDDRIKISFFTWSSGQK